eukprot:TRINITY_DN3000_c0_g1_i1.p1 TRINITY_DN3000_c0_g1~~TRINITY_DN3000_c0_g1_i1.p1  ORF type:complete len:431 (+),score=156.62 TRINITY_DN3000_c0_g1_i1:162-1454(+)
MSARNPVLAIVCGGGPAPGMNGVISAVAIEAISRGWDVIGLKQGFRHVMTGNCTEIMPLTLDTITRIHFMGGSVIGTSRANPTKKAEDLRRTVDVLVNKLFVRYLVTIGGDDTALTSSHVAAAAKGAISVAHVPKTIDNDLPLDRMTPTFGYETAREIGAELLRNLMTDAKTSGRWFIVVAMGRKAGHLALGIGKSASATLSIIPEEFKGKTLTFDIVCDIVEGSVLKRLARGREDGVAVLAEGLVEAMSIDDIQRSLGTKDMPLDEFDHIRLDDVDFGTCVRNELRERMKAYGLNIGFTEKKLGYELRCAPPNAFDREYTRDLGYGAVKYLASGESGALVTYVGGSLKPMSFDELRDPATGKTRVRMVDIESESYEVATHYMIRLEKKDFDEGSDLWARIASAVEERSTTGVKVVPDDLRNRFKHLFNL